MRIGLFGGTFDPPHTGHIEILKAAAEAGNFDKVIIMPSAVPPKKSIHDVSMPSYRFEMMRICLEGLDLDTELELSDLEMNRREKSYTIDTVRDIKKSLATDTEVFLICGSDIIFEIDSWHEHELLLNEAGIFVAVRPGYDQEELSAKKQELIRRFSAKIAFFNAPYIDISSALLRDRYFNGSPAPEGSINRVLDKWIQKNRLYDRDLRWDNDLTEYQLTDILKHESLLRIVLSGRRLIHSLNTMRVSAALAASNGEDPYRCAIAGLLHDCTKQDHYMNGKTEDDIVPEIRHAYSGSRVAENKFGVSDKEILDAIRFHTTSRAGASIMEKIIFVADKIEPSRDFPRIDEIRRISFYDLENGYHECLKDIILHLENSGKKAHADTYGAFEESKKSL